MSELSLKMQEFRDAIQMIEAAIVRGDIQEIEFWVKPGEESPPFVDFLVECSDGSGFGDVSHWSREDRIAQLRQRNRAINFVFDIVFNGSDVTEKYIEENAVLTPEAVERLKELLRERHQNALGVKDETATNNK